MVYQGILKIQFRACPRNKTRLPGMAFVAKKSGVFRGQNTILVKKTLKNVNTRTGSLST